MKLGPGSGDRKCIAAGRSLRGNAPEGVVVANDRPVALVSGGSRGIGRGVVTRLARDGYDLSFCYHANDEAAEVVSKAAGELGATVLARRVDVADGKQV